MSRLRKAARRNAKLQYGPVLRDLRRQRGEARQTYRTGRRQARQDARDIGRAARRSASHVERDYRQAGREMRFVDKLGGDVGEGVFAEADALSRRQTKRGLASAMAGDIADLEARAVRAHEGAAYASQSLFDAMQGALKDIGHERAATKREQGQFALSELQRLQGEREDQRLAAADDARADAQLAISQGNLAVSKGNLRLSRKRERHAERERAHDRAHPGSSGSADTVHSQGIKQQILDATAKYRREMAKGTPLHEIAADARKHDVSDQVLDAASRMATLGYLTPDAVRKLRAIGVKVPRAWRTPPRKG